MTSTLPLDPALPGLEAIRRHGSGAIRIPGVDLRGAATRLRGYSRGDRATLEVRAGDRRFAVKTMAGDPEPEAALHRRLRAAGDRFGVQVSPLLGVDRELRLYVVGWLEGPTASELIRLGRGGLAGRLVARWLRCLASLSGESSEPIDPFRVLDWARTWVVALTAAESGLGATAERVERSLHENRARTGALHLIHGSLYPRHALDAPGGAALIDWDRFGQGPTEYDAGTFLACVSRSACHHAERVRECARAESALLAEASDLLDARPLAWYRAAVLLQLAKKQATRKDDIGRERAGILLKEAAQQAETASPQRLSRWIPRLGLLAAFGASLLCGAGGTVATGTIARPVARVATEPVPHKGDAADDPALWIHPNDPGKSLLLGTDKQGGLHLYDLDGSDRGVVSDGSRPNNVDVLYGFSLGGREIDLALASVRGKPGTGVKVWGIDASRRQLSDLTQDGVITTHGGKEPYGLCAYRSRRTGRFFFFATSRHGTVEQWELERAGGGTIGARRVRSFSVQDVTEGCVADQELGLLYVSAENKGILKLDAEPDGDTRGRWIARVGQNGLAADVEGLAIYYGTGARGYLIASSQGNDTFVVYERAGDNRYVLTIDPASGRMDDVNDTDGIDVTSCSISPQFARGVLVVQDGTNPGGNQNFKLYSWEEIAGGELLIDTSWSPRAGIDAHAHGGAPVGRLPWPGIRSPR